MDDKAYAELKSYLRRLSWALASLPERDRDDVVEETRVHVLARTEQGHDLSASLAALGPADAYAARFIDEMEISGALASQRITSMLAAVAKRAHRSLAALIGFLGVLFLASWGLGWLVTAVVKPFSPQHAGVWASPHAFFVGVAAHPSPELHELVGAWIYPLAVVNILLAWFLARLLLVWSIRMLAKRD